MGRIAMESGKWMRVWSMACFHFGLFLFLRLVRFMQFTLCVCVCVLYTSWKENLAFNFLTISILAPSWHKSRHGPSPRLLFWQHFGCGAFWTLYNLLVFLSLKYLLSSRLTEHFQGTINFLLHQIFKLRHKNLQAIKTYKHSKKATWAWQKHHE